MDAKQTRLAAQTAPPGGRGTCPLPGLPFLADAAFREKENLTFDPLPVRGLGAQRIMLKTHHFAHLIQKLKLGIRNKPSSGFDAFAFQISNPTTNIKPY
jgi:hypothetical protein